MKFSCPALRAGSLRSPARSAGQEGQSQTTTTTTTTTTTNSQIISTKFISGLDLITDHWSLVTLITLSLLLLPLAAGCRLAQQAVDMPGQTVRAVTPGKKGKPSADPVEVQQTVLRFADEYLARMVVGVDKLQRGTNALAPAEVLKESRDRHRNLFHCLRSKRRRRPARPDRLRHPDTDGPGGTLAAQGLRRFCTTYAGKLPELEAEIWQDAGTVLRPQQQVELRQSIESWHRQNPNPEDVLAARAMSFASQVAKANQADTKADSVFSLLQLDPLSGLDPAVRELAQTRLFAERALFVAQKMPVLLRWQTELLSVNAVEMPAVQQLVTNSTEISASVERFSRVAEQLPRQVSKEREEILKALQSQEKNLTPLVGEVRQTLTAGSQCPRR